MHTPQHAFPAALEELINELTRLPGIGRRTAQRLALQLLRGDRSQALQLATVLRSAAERITSCELCHGLAEAPRCRICADTRRDPSLLCVVEQPTDVLLIEQGAGFRGRYHVLGGALSPIDGIGPGELHLADLARRLDASVEEVIIATSPTVGGEATASYVAELLAGRVRMTRLASGMPVGVDMEHVDELTLSRAFSGRSDIASL